MVVWRRRRTQIFATASLAALVAATVPAMANAQVGGGGQNATPMESASGAGAPVLGEVVVTAQKRSQRLQDTPLSVTALDTTTLVAHNQTSLQDYFTQVPGLSLNNSGDGSQNIVIRGISTGTFGNPTVGVTIDDVPFGAATALGGGQLYQPDLDPADLSQIEVLRGPQGTLYGASALGGLIKYVTITPSTQGFSGRLESDVDGATDGGVGYGVRGTANIPITDTLALAIGGFSRRTPGYINDVQTGQTDVNMINAAGIHASLLWTPIPLLSVKLGALYQHTLADAGSNIQTSYSGQPVYGDLKDAFLPNSGGYRIESALYSLNVDLHLGWATLTSISGYGNNFYRSASDTSAAFNQPPYLLPSSTLGNQFADHRFSQELRLSSPINQKFEWIVGGFYTRDESPTVQTINGVDPTSSAVRQTPLREEFTTTYEESALFGDATYHFTRQFDIQGGVRVSTNHQTYDEADFGALGEIAPGVPFTIAQKTTDSDVTFLVVPEFRFSRDLLAYVRIASGYRPGGLNADAPLFNLPNEFKADTTLNYEAGLKGDLLDRKLTYDVSAYYIDWNNVQLTLIDPVSQFSFFQNGGKALSTGLEGEVQYQPIRSLHLAANASYNVAELSKTPPPSVFAKDGARLPYTPHFSGSFSADQDFPITDQVMGFVGGTLSYVGDRLGALAPTAGSLRPVLPSYVTLDLRLGAKSGPWTANLYARNVSDERGLLSSKADQGGVSLATGLYRATYIQPCTIGLSVARVF